MHNYVMYDYMLFASFYSLFITQPAGLILVLVTLVVGSFALILYRKQFTDEKQRAAQTIYSEISSAENKLKGIRSRFFATEQPALESDTIMPYASWSKYKHLFFTDLNTEQWNLVDEFYNNCSAYDSAVNLNKRNISQIISANYQHQYEYYAKIAEKFHKEHPQATELSDEAIKDVLSYQKVFLDDKAKNAFDYVPRQGVSEARTALVALDTSVSVSEAGIALKKIARL